MIYADTSVLLSAYGSDAMSSAADQLLLASNGPLVVTSAHEAEFVNGLNLRLFRLQMSSADATQVLADFQSDFTSGYLVVTPLPWNVLWHQVQVLSLKHTALLGTRMLDVLHVAGALHLQVREFLTFDKRQASLARAEGLSVKGA